MSQIEISCFGSNAIFTNTPNIFSGGNVDSVKFKFDSEWSGFTTKTAVFYTNPKETALQILDSNNVANIPAEMLANKGKLSIGVIGTNANNDVKTSKILTYIIDKGAVTDDMETTSATPDIWLQLLSIVEHNRQIVDDMELVVDESQMANKANKDLSNVSSDTLYNKGMLILDCGTYDGVGGHGSNKSSILTFNFSPLLVVITGTSHQYVCYRNTDRSSSLYDPSNLDYKIRLTWTDRSLSWYSNYSDEVQNNVSGVKYQYIAIGKAGVL